jgi:putative phage-type endonuclease
MHSTDFSTRGVGCAIPEGGITTMQKPVPVLGWEADRATWLQARTKGISASDVAILLGESTYKTPWSLWAEKTGRIIPEEATGEAIEIGNALEPWLRIRAEKELGRPFAKTAYQLYSHPEHPWMLASPDAQELAGKEGLELKTAALATYGKPQEWDNDQIPLAYEFQTIWQNMIMGWERNNLFALVGTRGLQHRIIERNPELEKSLFDQVNEWYQKHIIEDIEPDGATYEDRLNQYKQAQKKIIELPSSALDAAFELKNINTKIKYLEKEQDKLKAEIAAQAGEATELYVGDTLIATWRKRRGSISNKAALEDAIEQGYAEDLEQFRGASTRTFSLKIKDAA